MYLSIYPNLSIYLSIYRHLFIYLHPSIYLSIYLSNQSICYQSICYLSHSSKVAQLHLYFLFYFIFSQSRITVQYSMYIQAIYQVHCRPCICSGPSESDKREKLKIFYFVNHKYHLTSYSIYCYSIVSSGAPLFVNFVLINQSLIVTYILLCCI